MCEMDMPDSERKDHGHDRLNVDEAIQFCGHAYSGREYESVCQNLSEFFSILLEWQKMADEGKEKEDL
jgi:hypothetical protein